MRGKRRNKGRVNVHKFIFNCLLTAAHKEKGRPVRGWHCGPADNSLNVAFDIEPKLALIKRDNKANSYTKRNSS